jgi:hypothetical protein
MERKERQNRDRMDDSMDGLGVYQQLVSLVRESRADTRGNVPLMPDFTSIDNEWRGGILSTPFPNLRSHLLMPRQLFPTHGLANVYALKLRVTSESGGIFKSREYKRAGGHHKFKETGAIRLFTHSEDPIGHSINLEMTEKSGHAPSISLAPFLQTQTDVRFRKAGNDKGSLPQMQLERVHS